MSAWIVSALLLSLSGLQTGTADQAIDVGMKKQIFLDGYFMEEQEGVTLRMHRPYRDGQVLIQSEQSWELDPEGGQEHRIGVYSCVLKEGNRVRVWYDCRRGPLSPEIRVCYAESEDGIHFRKPLLGLHEVDGSTANNVVIPGPRIAGAAVWLDPKAPPEHRYKTQTKVYPSSKLEMHSSPDGIHWTLFAIPEVGHIDTQSIIFWEPSVSRYLLYTRLWALNEDRARRYRTVRRLESDNLLDWEQEKIVMTPDEQDWNVHQGSSERPPVDFYGGGVFRYAEADKAYLMFAQSTWAWMDWEEEGYGPATIDVQLAVSRDAESFRRVGERRAFMGLGPEGRFDSRFVWAMPNPIRMGDELWIYYVGTNRDHSPSDKVDSTATQELSGIGRAVLRLDGFVSVDAGYTEGHFTTPLLRFSGNRLELNVDAGGGGAVRVEVLDEAGQPIEGFSREAALPIVRNSVRMPVAWKSGSDLSTLSGKPVRLRFYLTNASLYAFQFKGGIEGIGKAEVSGIRFPTQGYPEELKPCPIERGLE